VLRIFSKSSVLIPASVMGAWPEADAVAELAALASAVPALSLVSVLPAPLLATFALVAPVPLVLVDRPPDSAPVPPPLSEPPPHPARNKAATAAATIEVEVVDLISMSCDTSRFVKGTVRAC